MWRILLLKDLRRARRNPLPWVIQLALPLLITALIGLAFGPAANQGGLGRIRFALVDEDNSPVTAFLRGAVNQERGGKYLEPVFLARDEAMRQIQKDQISAAVIIPTNFTRNYLTSTSAVSMTLIKNPAQSIYPAVMEELLGALVTAMSALKRHLGPELILWQEVFADRGDYHRAADLIVRTGDKVETFRRFLFPPLVTCSFGDKPEAAPKTEPKTVTPTGKPKPGMFSANIFGFLLPGLAAMFLLFIGNLAAMDAHRELTNRTFDRFCTLQPRQLVYVLAKMGFALVILGLASLIMLGGGGMLFQIDWRAPFKVAVLTASYCLFVAGLMMSTGSLFSSRQQADTFGSITGMLIGIAGGCAFPAEQLPALIREQVAPFLPNYWFVEAVRNLCLGNGTAPWGAVSLKSALLGLGLAVVAAALLRRRLQKGIRVT